jgi:catechol 2,3-dioxygenase-like lactoylglutathione lyase family enzyme
MTMAEQGSSAAITGVHTVGIAVSDQDRALAFYADILGLEVRLDRPLANGQRWIEVAAPGAAVSLALEPAHDGHPAGVETGVRLQAPDVEATHAALKAHDVVVGDVLRWPGVPPMFAFRDQDGNGLEVVEA